MWTKLFILTIVLGLCAAATVTDVEKIKIPQSDEGQDLKAAESTNRQFGHGGYGGYPGGFGGYGNQAGSGFGGYGGYGAGWSQGGYGSGYPHGGGYGHGHNHHHG